MQPSRSITRGKFTIGHRGPNNNKALRMIRFVCNFYNRNSRGIASFEPKLNGRANYIFNVRPGLRRNNVGNLTSYNHSVATHECGHRLRLGHSKTVARVQRGPQKGKPGQDTTNIMNGKAIMNSPLLLAVQLYHKGWLRDDEWRIMKEKTETIRLKRTGDWDSRELMTFIIPSELWNDKKPGTGNPIFISYPWGGTRPRLMTHFKMGGGTRLIFRSDENMYHSHTGLNIKILESSNKEYLDLEINCIGRHKK
jgi:hypothetical protein